jgi:hypothetical protein
MAAKPGRFAEARLYLAGGSIGLMLALWALFAVKDNLPVAAGQAQPESGPGLSGQPQQSTPQPQTKTGGS